jgi:molybdenum cofactor cytidylyltransferase
VVFGASAVVDEGDVIPAGIRQAGGEVIRFGMPVDPGNLLVLGRLGGTPVIGAPGCARSPKENGFDWILSRLLAGLDVPPDAIAGLGVGGLLTEISSRPQPREGGAPTKRVAALLLAAGQSKRMGGPNKLLATIGNTPLVRIAAEAALASEADSLTVVTGHQAASVRSALAGLNVRYVHNPDYANGLSTSLRAGLHSLPEGVNGVAVMLADMPKIDASVLDRLITTFFQTGGDRIVVPTWQGRRGNPVVWSSRFFPELMAVTGDAGGRYVLGQEADSVIDVELGEAVGLDVDTPEALAAAGGAAGTGQPENA